MATTLPMHPIAMPAMLAPYAKDANGRLPSAVLVSTPGLGGGPAVLLAGPATRAWRALTAAAQAVGHVLTATSLYDSYRPYSVQESTFRARYTTSALAGRPSVLWQGSRWYQRAGTAVAAVPGTSNHGLGLAVDVAGVDGHLAWLLANADRFGWSWELQSEPWHIRYYRGDAIPAAVLAYEAALAAPVEVDMKLFRMPSGDLWESNGSWRRKVAGDKAEPCILDAWGMKSGDIRAVDKAMLDGRTEAEWLDIAAGADVVRALNAPVVSGTAGAPFTLSFTGTATAE